MAHRARRTSGPSARDRPPLRPSHTATPVPALIRCVRPLLSIRTPCFREQPNARRSPLRAPRPHALVPSLLWHDLVRCALTPRTAAKGLRIAGGARRTLGAAVDGHGASQLLPTFRGPDHAFRRGNDACECQKNAPPSVDAARASTTNRRLKRARRAREAPQSKPSTARRHCAAPTTHTDTPRRSPRHHDTTINPAKPHIPNFAGAAKIPTKTTPNALETVEHDALRLGWAASSASAAGSGGSTAFLPSAAAGRLRGKRSMARRHRTAAALRTQTQHADASGSATRRRDPPNSTSEFRAKHDPSTAISTNPLRSPRGRSILPARTSRNPAAP